MTIHTRKVLLPLLVAALAGCASAPVPIKESTAPDASKIRFITDVPDRMIHLFPENECNNGIVMAHLTEATHAIRSATTKAPVSRVGMLDSPDASNFNVREIAVNPGQRINLGSSIRLPQCFGGLSFTAAPATQYEVSVVSTARSRCALRVAILAERDGTVVRLPGPPAGPMVCKAPEPYKQ